MLNDVAAHAREDVFKVSDPKAQALFGSIAVVLKGLVKAFNDFEEKARGVLEDFKFSISFVRWGLLCRQIR